MNVSMSFRKVFIFGVCGIIISCILLGVIVFKSFKEDSSQKKTESRLTKNIKIAEKVIVEGDSEFIVFGKRYVTASSIKLVNLKVFYGGHSKGSYRLRVDQNINNTSVFIWKRGGLERNIEEILVQSSQSGKYRVTFYTGNDITLAVKEWAEEIWDFHIQDMKINEDLISDVIMNYSVNSDSLPDLIK